MKLIFVDTQALLNKAENHGPILVFDVDTKEVIATHEVEIFGYAKLVYDHEPEHNLARVWVQVPDTIPITVDENAKVLKDFHTHEDKHLTADYSKF